MFLCIGAYWVITWQLCDRLEWRSSLTDRKMLQGPGWDGEGLDKNLTLGSRRGQMCRARMWAGPSVTPWERRKRKANDVSGFQVQVTRRGRKCLDGDVLDGVEGSRKTQRKAKDPFVKEVLEGKLSLHFSSLALLKHLILQWLWEPQAIAWREKQAQEMSDPCVIVVCRLVHFRN